MTESTTAAWVKWGESLQILTERYLTWRKTRKRARNEKQKRRGPVVDWVDAILSAVVIVLLINQYLLQAYQIPSPSMEPSLLVTDRIFVNKYVYGPELAPGMWKLPGAWQPQRGDVVIFESPEYLSSGPVMDVLQRVVYMLTLSLVDIDKDENGQPKHHFLIKRAIGMPGDRIRMDEGKVEYLTPGESAWVPEADMKKALGFSYENVRRIQPEEYPVFREAGIGEGLMDAKLPIGPAQESAIKNYYNYNQDTSGRMTGYTSSLRKLADDIYVVMWKNATRWAIEPANTNAAADWREAKEGYAIAEDSIFPMGDNRDNSRDARYFGSVRLTKVLGKGLFRYWPPYRWGGIR
jgi:signal peptidase I